MKKPRITQVIIAINIAPIKKRQANIIFTKIGSIGRFASLTKQSTDSNIVEPSAMNEMVYRNVFRLSPHDKSKL
jgi:hypothetical protein